MRFAWMLAALATGCIADPSVTCNGLTCPQHSVCRPDGCADPAAVDACADRAEGDVCMTPAIPLGHCLAGVCRESVCGNGRVEFGEVCDDGNLLGGDGCSALCDSTEVCGNDVVDYVLGEQCDSGIAGLSGDGCTSQCTIEVDDWRDVTPQGISVRADYAMAYDTARGRLVVFGGSAIDLSGSALGDTWEWDGVSWRTLSVPVSPPPRFGATLAYDPITKTSILFGGGTGADLLQDTWAWDGITWQELHPAGAIPDARVQAASVFDPSIGKIVLFGGRTEIGSEFNDTWTWDGTAWTQIFPASMPAARSGLAMTYDAGDGYVLMYGGGAETWAWYGATSTWTRLTTAAMMHPNAIRQLALAYDGTSVIAFGGADNVGTPYAETWTWMGGSWQRLGATGPSARIGIRAAYDGTRVYVLGGNVGVDVTDLSDLWAFTDGASPSWTSPMAASPPARGHASMAYDPLRARVVMFGGGTGPYNGETWEWDGQAWERRSVTGPPRRADAAIGYDEAHHVTVMFGGKAGAGSLSDTWMWDGTTWTPATPVTVPPAGDGRMLYDAVLAQLVLVTGGNGVGIELWAWNGTDWTQLTPQATAPTETSAFGAAYDRARDRIVTFGGMSSAGLTNETWEWDGAAWHALTPATTPTPRANPSLVYDEVRQRIMMFGGGRNAQRFSDTWEWDGSSWRMRLVASSPAPRNASAATYDRARARVTIFGGNGGGGIALPDTWVYGFASADVPRDSCFAGIDSDGDGLVSCADPDCWGVCTPLCPPGTTCDLSQPHCGDGTCSSIESYLVCPADCP